MTPWLRAVSAALAFGLLASLAQAGPIENACMSSGRDEANRSVCGCIQQVADQMLTSTDQRRAAKFFSDPELAHKTWMSDKARDDAFWERWQSFGGSAELYCAG